MATTTNELSARVRKLDQLYLAWDRAWQDWASMDVNTTAPDERAKARRKALRLKKKYEAFRDQEQSIANRQSESS